VENYTLPISATDNPLFYMLEEYLASFGEFDVESLPASAFSSEFETDVDDLLLVDEYQKAHEAYLGTDIYWTTGGGCDYQILENQRLPLKTGLNTFLLPFGEIPADVPESVRYTIPLNGSSLLESGATAGSGLNASDIIWTVRGGDVEGAWLKDFSQERVSATACTKINSGRTLMRFPFIGRGVSGEGVGWSGPTISNCNQPILVAENIEQLERDLEDLYWNDTITLSTVDTIGIHETTLIAQGAHASKNYFDADKITVRPTPRDDIDDGVYNGEETKAFLYDFTHTQIPILPGTNEIYWPLHRYESLRKIPFEMSPTQCQAVALSALVIEQDFAGSVAGSTPDEADKIFRKRGVCGNRIEGAWLRSSDLNTTGLTHFTKGAYQSSMSFVVEAGEQQRFLWNFPTQKANDVFVGYKHDEYCPYKHLIKHPSFLSNTNQLNAEDDFSKWKQCKCKAVYYSPCGHEHPNRSKFSEYSDYIVEDLGYDEPFSFGTWKDENGLDFRNSPRFATARYNGFEPDVGWGSVNWKTNKDESFFLKKGVNYIYGRASLNSCVPLPPLVTNLGFCDSRTHSYSPQWRSLILKSDGSFIDGGEKTNMVFYPTDILEYDRIESSNYSFTKTDPRGSTNTINYINNNAAFV